MLRLDKGFIFGHWWHPFILSKCSSFRSPASAFAPSPAFGLRLTRLMGQLVLSCVVFLRFIPFHPYMFKVFLVFSFIQPVKHHRANYSRHD